MPFFPPAHSIVTLTFLILQNYCGIRCHTLSLTERLTYVTKPFCNVTGYESTKKYHIILYIVRLVIIIYRHNIMSYRIDINSNCILCSYVICFYLVCLEY